MKRILALLLALVMVLGCFAGCSSKDEKSNSKTQASDKNDNNATGKESEEIVNKELHASQVFLADTMLLSEKLSKGAEMEVSVNVSFVPKEEIPTENLPAFLSSILTKNDDGSYNVVLTFVGTANESGSKVTIKLGDKALSECIVTSDMKIYFNLKLIWDFIFGLMGQNIPWSNPNEYVEVNELLSLVTGGSTPDLESVINEMEFGNMIPEEYMTMILESIETGELNAELSAMMEEVLNTISAVFNKAEVSTFANDLLVKIAETNLMVITENSISLNVNSENIKNATTSVLKLVEANGDDVFKSVIDTLDTLNVIDETQKEALSKMTVEAIKSKLEEGASFEEIEAAFDEALAVFGESYINTEFKIDDTSIKYTEEISIDMTVAEKLLTAQKVPALAEKEMSNSMSDIVISGSEGELLTSPSEEAVDEQVMPFSNVKVGVSITLAVKSVAPIAAPTNVIAAQELVELFSFLEMMG